MNRIRFVAVVPLLALASLSYAQPPSEWTEERILESVSIVRAGKVLTPSSGPGGARVADCLSFGVDNETHRWLGRGGPHARSHGLGSSAAKFLAP